MDMAEPKVFDATEPLSKALDDILKTGTAAFVTKNKELFGLIDDRNLRMGITDASKMKCENACVKCPSLKQSSSIPERIDAFMTGHFKALPVIDAKGWIIGATSRSDLLRDMRAQNLVPKAAVYQYMNRPAYTIETGQTIADVKSAMKKTGGHHFVVMRAGNIVGTISTFDFTGLFAKNKERQSYQIISEVKNFDSKRVDEVYRDNFVTIEETATLDEAADRMAKEGISNVIVVSAKKPTGVLSATDIFKLVRKLYTEEKDVLVSGLDEDNLVYYERIKQDILGVVSKFDKSLKVENITVHIKKGKSVFEANLALDLNNRHVAFKREGYNIAETVALLVKELKIVLEKDKTEKTDQKRQKERPEE